MANGDDAQNIWRTLENMNELGASLGSFDDILETRLGESFYLEWINRAGGTHWTNNEWACYAYWYACKLRQKIAGRPYIGAATFKIELWRPAGAEDTAWHHSKTPLIYVAFCPDHNDWWGDFGLDQYGVPSADGNVGIDPPQQDSIWLWEWTENDREALWRDRSWFYAVPLTAVNKHGAVGVQIVEPLEALVLTEMCPDEIFAGRHAISGGDFRE